MKILVSLKGKAMDNVKEKIANLIAQERVTGNSGVQRGAMYAPPFAEFYITSHNGKLHIDGRYGSDLDRLTQ
jgi:hypothetical protein